MKFRKSIAIAFCMAVLFSATACNTSRLENASNPNAASSDSKNSSSETLSSAHETASAEISGLKDDPAESTDISATKKGVNMDRYGLMYRNDYSGIAYNINGNMYIDINDVSSLSKTGIKYNSANHMITFGDETRPSAAFYMPDFSAYPDFDYSCDNEVINDLSDVHWLVDGVTDLKCVTKDVPFQDAIKKIDKKLKSDGFTAATEKQYTELTSSLSEFKQGKMKNSYIKYGSDKEEYVIQLIDGGLNKNKTPMIIVRLKGKSGYSKKNWVENASNVSTIVSGTLRKGADVKSASVPATRTKAEVKYYNLKANIDVYKIDEKLYMNLNDVSRLFRTKIIYDQANRSISFGDCTQASPASHMSYDFSEYPNLEDVIGLPPFEIWSEDSVVANFKFAAKDDSFQNIKNEIDEKLKSEGFAVATKKQYNEIPITSSTNAFKQGKINNTYIKNNRVKYSNGELSSDTFQSVIQIIDGGLDRNKFPIITVKMLDGYYN